MATGAVQAFRLGDIAPKADPRSLLVYLILALLVPVTWAAYRLTGLTLVSWNWFVPAAALWCIFLAQMFRRAGRERIAATLETMSLMAAQGTAIVLLQFPLIALGFPFADAGFVQFDRALGFDWSAFAALFNHPLAMQAITLAYGSMTLQAALILPLLCFTGRIERAWQLITATLIGLCITSAIFPFLPADGSFVLCAQSAVLIPPGHCDYVPVIRDIHSGALTQIDRSMRLGMVSFPSFHTAAALLLAWAVWPYRWLRAPSIILNAAMLCGTIVVGAHYLVDVIGGALVATAAVVISNRSWFRSRTMFRW